MTNQASPVLVFPLPVPLCPPFDEDSFEEFTRRFHVRVLIAPIFGEFAFDGGFEDGGFVALEIGLNALEVRDGFVEAGESVFRFLQRYSFVGR